jgi:hypothetical protein
MPLGGYCEKCQRWVWLTPYGECENGHGSKVIRDVQQLKAQPSSDLVPASHSTAVPARPRQRRWWWRHSLWIVWTLTFGFANYIAFFYTGFKARRPAWIASGFVYLLPVVLTLSFMFTGYGRYFFALQVFLSAASFLQALYIRPLYRAIMFGDVAPRTLAAPPQPPALPAANERRPLAKGADERAGDVIRVGRGQVDGIRDMAGGIGKPPVRERVAHLCGTADQILDELAGHPRKVDAARSFLTYYLDAAERIVRGYVDLSRRGATSTETRATLAKAEASLASVQKAFDHELESVLQDKVLDLDSEIELLEKTVRMDNLFNQTGGS